MSSIGRAATIAAHKKSYDLRDDAEGLDAGPQIKANAGLLYQAPPQAEPRKEEAPPKEAKTAEIPPTAPASIEETGLRQQTNGITV
jgi:hypothetical protein